MFCHASCIALIRPRCVQILMTIFCSNTPWNNDSLKYKSKDLMRKSWLCGKETNKTFFSNIKRNILSYKLKFNIIKDPGMNKGKKSYIFSVLSSDQMKIFRRNLMFAKCTMIFRLNSFRRFVFFFFFCFFFFFYGRLLLKSRCMYSYMMIRIVFGTNCQMEKKCSRL